MKAMILAAGLGTRLLNETKEKPKALVEVAGKPLLQHAIEKLKKEGVTEIVVNVHHFPELIVSWIDSHDFNIPIHVSDESEMLLETGGGLKKAAPFLKGNDPVIIYNVDVLSDVGLEKVKTAHLDSGALATLVVRYRKTSRYLKFDDQMRLMGWVNKKTGELKISRPGNFEAAVEMAFSGIQIVQPEIFDLMPAENKFSITDFYLKLAEQHLVKGFFDESEFWMDVGKPDELERAKKLYL